MDLLDPKRVCVSRFLDWADHFQSELRVREKLACVGQFNSKHDLRDQVRVRGSFCMCDKDCLRCSVWTQLCFRLTALLAWTTFNVNVVCVTTWHCVGQFESKHNMRGEVSLRAWVDLNLHLTYLTMFVCVGHFESKLCMDGLGG